MLSFKPVFASPLLTKRLFSSSLLSDTRAVSSSYAGLHKSQAGIKIAGRNIKIHRYEDDTALMAEIKELKRLLMRRGDAKTVLKINIQTTIHKNILNIHGIRSHHIMAYR